jgi:hypothetical protein
MEAVYFDGIKPIFFFALYFVKHSKSSEFEVPVSGNKIKVFKIIKELHKIMQIHLLKA